MDADQGGGLLERVRGVIAGPGVTEQRMFGGICFLLDGNMLAGVSQRGLLLRLGKQGFDEALARPGTAAMEMRGRPMAGYLYVDPGALDNAALADWLGRAVAFVRTLPPKPASSKPKRGASAKAPPSRS